MSLKAYDTDIKVAVLHDEASLSHLTEKEKGLFDIKIPIKEEAYTFEGKKHYQFIKLCADIYTPFENTTVIDADTIWFPDKKFSWFLGEMMHHDFYIGYNGEFDVKKKVSRTMNYTYWGDPLKIVDFYDLENDLPQTVSGLFFFKKCEFTKVLFEKCRKIYIEDSPNIPWANGKPDEFCFNVALSQLGYKQEKNHIVYFDKVCGVQPYESIYGNYWCMANGGAKCEPFVINLYNKLVKKYAIRLGFENLYFHENKKDFIPERKSF